MLPFHLVQHQRRLLCDAEGVTCVCQKDLCNDQVKMPENIEIGYRTFTQLFTQWPTLKPGTVKKI